MLSGVRRREYLVGLRDSGLSDEELCTGYGVRIRIVTMSVVGEKRIRKEIAWLNEAIVVVVSSFDRPLRSTYAPDVAGDKEYLCTCVRCPVRQ